MSADKPDDTRSHDTDFAAMWSSDGVTRSLASTATGLPADLPFLFSGGQHFGPYLIVRPIGKGGMGQVYEAEETDSGRRVAIKILSRGIGDDEERDRFLREGQLAASLSHPNCVYVFGTTEIQGFPVIAMELAPAGTLKELVQPGTPTSSAGAVDAILQVIDGLEAAAAIGILHRDIKPSNCFVDRDGRVMVGDFGLSIATLSRDGAASEAGTILGTPGFASPEQLRGDALDVRSDIYSVGATIYYLLTGKAPFDDPDIRTMMTRVASETAPAVTIARPDLPGRLGAVVARCLATKPGDRYATYKALAAALEPFRTAVIAPAPLGRRFLAGFIDSYAAALPMMPFNILLGARLLDAERRGDLLFLTLPSVVSSILYYSVLEGRFGCAAGKAALNLRVVDESGHPPGYRRALLRALAFIVPMQIVVQGVSFGLLKTLGSVSASGNFTASLTAFAVVLMTFVSLIALFLTARRRNGYAALHDLASRTRVVLRPRAIEARQAARRKDAAPHAAAAGRARIGPYVVTEQVLSLAAGLASPIVVDGYDDRLRRGVWIELLPPGTPPVPAWRRDLNRPGRARWLSGRRTPAECWDAYEAMDGRPLKDTAGGPQPWARVRHWMADLAREIAAAVRDGSLPALRYERIWITNDDRARLLDWPPPTAQAETSPAEPDPERFLYGVAAGALRGVDAGTAVQQPPSIPLPSAARELLLAMRDGTAGGVDAIAGRAVALLRDVPEFPRRRRLLQLGVCAMVPVIMVVAVFSVLKMQLRARTADPAAYALQACLNQISGLDKKGDAGLTPAQREQRELLEIYIAEYLRAPAEEKAAYAKAFPAVSSLQKEYRIAERALARHAQRSPEQLKKAEALVATVIANNTRGLEQMNRPVVLWGVLGVIAGGALLFVAVLGLIGALAARGGFTLRAFGARLVTADGRDASRLRALVRAAVAWSPLVLWIVTVKFAPAVQQTTAATAWLYTLVVALVLGGAAWAWRHPSRGIQDRIAGTWIVPR